MLKVVLDTNIFISGILTKEGNPSLIIKAWKRSRKYELFVTEEIIQEALSVMKKLKVNPSIIADWDHSIRKNAVTIIPGRKIDAIEEDPADNKFLECAIEADVDYIVTGDKHLKRLDKFEGIKIIDAKRFLDILKSCEKEKLH